jgi:AAA ATPase domain
MAPTSVLPSGGTLLLEREAQVAALQALADATRGGGGRFVVIEGGAGIGKTRLLAEGRAISARPAARSAQWCIDRVLEWGSMGTSPRSRVSTSTKSRTEWSRCRRCGDTDETRATRTCSSEAPLRRSRSSSGGVAPGAHADACRFELPSDHRGHAGGHANDWIPVG